MYLREIRIRATNPKELNYEPPFEWTLHHVREIYVALLPPKFTLDGSSLLQIFCGQIDETLKHPSVLGIRNYYIGEFDFGAYYKLNTTGKEEVIIKLIEFSILGVASELNLDIDTNKLTETSEYVRKSNCSLKLYSKKLSRIHAKSKLKVSIFRNLSSEYGEAWSFELSRKDNTLAKDFIDKEPWYFNRRDYFKKSSWEDTFFVIRNHLDEEVFRFDINNFLIN
jgi:hypothetical protein